MRGEIKFIGLIFLSLCAPLVAGTQSDLGSLAGIRARLDLNPIDKKAWSDFEKLAVKDDVLVRGQVVYSVGNSYQKNRLKGGVKMEELAWPFILRGFDDASIMVRQAAYQEAWLFEDRAHECMPYLIRGLDELGSVGASAADSLGKLKSDSPLVITALIGQLEKGPRAKGGDSTQHSAARSLGKMRGQANKAIPKLEEIIQKSSNDPEYLYLISENLYWIDPHNLVAIKALKDIAAGKYPDAIPAAWAEAVLKEGQGPK